MTESEVLSICVSSVLGIIAYLLAQKDSKQQKDIDTLFELHKADEKELVDLRVKLAESYHPKPEIQAMMDGFKRYLDERFASLERILTKGNKNETGQ